MSGSRTAPRVPASPEFLLLCEAVTGEEGLSPFHRRFLLHSPQSPTQKTCRSFVCKTFSFRRLLTGTPVQAFFLSDFGCEIVDVFPKPSLRVFAVKVPRVRTGVRGLKRAPISHNSAVSGSFAEDFPYRSDRRWCFQLCSPVPFASC